MISPNRYGNPPPASKALSNVAAYDPRHPDDRQESTADDLHNLVQEIHKVTVCACVEMLR